LGKGGAPDRNLRKKKKKKKKKKKEGDSSEVLREGSKKFAAKNRRLVFVKEERQGCGIVRV